MTHSSTKTHFSSLCLTLSFLAILHHQQPAGASAHQQSPPPLPPLPVLPLPSFSQLKWQQKEIIMFLHFGINTFTGSEWGSGRESPAHFNPTGLNPAQWVQTAREAGVSLLILTAKHHDGFCLWPSKYTDHSVRSSPWKNGGGDVVEELVEAATRPATTAGAHGGRVDVGLYLSPWDRHDWRYGNDELYNEYYLAQLQELLSRYGKVKEIWFDGAKDPRARNMSYYFGEWFAMAKQLQRSINIFSDAGPDLRWVGNEHGFAGSTCWSTVNRSLLSIGDSSIEGYLKSGDPKGTDWVPAECDVSIRKGWFWHKSQSPKKLSKLLEIYYNSVGRNCVLLINVPPNSTGLIPESDVQRLRELRSAIDRIFSRNLARECRVRASSQRGGDGGGFGPENVMDDDHMWTYWAPEEKNKDHWIQFEMKEGVRFNVVRIQEAIGLGQRIGRHEIYVDGEMLREGTTIGYKRLHRIVVKGSGAAAKGKVVRIAIKESKGLPLISSIGLHFDPYWHPSIH